MEHLGSGLSKPGPQPTCQLLILLQQQLTLLHTTWLVAMKYSYENLTGIAEARSITFDARSDVQTTLLKD